MLLEIARRRRAAELLAELAQLRQELLALDETPRRQARGTLRGVPRAEVLDHRLRVDARLGVGRELAHGRRPPQPPGRGAQLGEDLLVGIAPSQAGAERRERLLVDAGDRRVPASSPGRTQVL